jgi:VWA domain-containing protein/putative Flp pilus-assembly TadE/G-like protein
MAIGRRRPHQRGFAIIFYSTMLIFVTGCVGLAVDVGTIYLIKARLSAAADAAALAAGRSVNLADTVAQATTNAANTANQIFASNFPAGYFNSLGAPTVTPTFTEETDNNGNPSGTLDIKVTASVSAPTYFMNVFNVHNINVAATATATRRGLVLLLVLDQSSSMNTAADPVTGLTACQAMVAAAKNFVTLFSPYDRIGLITFDITAHMKDAPSQNRTQLTADLNAIVCNNNTNTISALELAYQQIKNTGLPLALNTIVLFTDGSPNGVSAAFPARASLDSRWGGATLASPAPPAQSGSTFGHTNACGDVGPQDANGSNEEAICINMPVVCSDPAATMTGTLAQQSGQDSWGGKTYGLAPPTDSDAVTYPASCSNTAVLPGQDIRQFIAYIPDTDKYGNDLHGVPSTSSGPTVVGGKVTRDTWLFQTTNLCSPDPTVSPNCKNTGDFWSNHTTIGSASNFFPTTNTYTNAAVYGTPTTHFRPDQPNTIVVASMNGTMSEANRIRSDTTYHPVIHTIYLTGNGTDAVDREFLPIVANAAQITALPYDPVSFTPYPNPAYQTSQETGRYLVTSDRNKLTSLFAQLASEVLRLSQ